MSKQSYNSTMLLHFFPLMVYPLVMLLLLSSLILAYLAFQIWFDQTQSNTSAQKLGATLVVAWAVERYVRRTFSKQCWGVNPSCWPVHIACLIALTNRSMAPFDAVWYGEQRMCVIQFGLVKDANSSEKNRGPLSDTIWSGRQYKANKCRSTAIVLVMVWLISKT